MITNMYDSTVAVYVSTTKRNSWLGNALSVGRGGAGGQACDDNVPLFLQVLLSVFKVHVVLTCTRRASSTAPYEKNNNRSVT